ncbi:hypothetical protein E9232_004904 [Inquilinus ginsengisoli]|uniref:DUF2730 family protein n=1 Tax=Inquilinus ginsengisoli TaxID=363840 RepID=A0ABU1JWH4_9PROT|nr:hypothetical protein [Inquilinus ginsengisoli]MDR6292364.1 hypothetical protein [Inquilinus ginsengisoli]
MSDTGKKADWSYRILMVVMTAAIGWGVNWIGEKVETLGSLPGQVRKIGDDQTALKVSVDDVKKAQEEMKRTQSGFATGEQVGTLRSDVDKLTGRVDTMETTVNSLVKPARPR